MKVRTIRVWHNPQKPSVREVAKRLLDFCTKNGIACALEDAFAEELKVSNYKGKCDVLAVLGGDGTILSGLDIALRDNMPILGINMGRMGFLSEVRTEHLEEDLAAFVAGEYRTEQRMLIETACDTECAYALNDITITRSDAVLSVEAYVDGTSVLRFTGDGLVVATPTGSTAYSMSAGGPIIYPTCDSIVLTPVCSHTMLARPVVLPAQLPVTIRVLGGAKDSGVFADGKRIATLSQDNTEITIAKSERCAQFIRLRDTNYFDLLRTKLSDWTH